MYDRYGGGRSEPPDEAWTKRAAQLVSNAQELQAEFDKAGVGIPSVQRKLAELDSRLVALEAEVVALRAQVLDLEGQRP